MISWLPVDNWGVKDWIDDCRFAIDDLMKSPGNNSVLNEWQLLLLFEKD